MAQNYEIADFDSHTPFRCVVHHIGHVQPHMHEYFEILFVLSGTCSVTVEEQLFSLHDGDLLVVESHISHELRASDCVYASVQLDQAALENNFPVPIHPKFSCNSTLPGNEDACDQLRHLIARLILNNADEGSGYELRNWILIYQLMDVLYTYFRIERSEAVDRRNHRYAQRIAELSGIINHHYTEDLPLSRVADMVHLSVPYLSKFFQEQFGLHYLTYLTQLRVNHAVHELVNTEKNIEEIAADSGFPNSHAFTKAFKNEYGMMPSVYRRRQRAQKKEAPPFGIEHSDYLTNLRKYLDLDHDAGRQLQQGDSGTVPPVRLDISLPCNKTVRKLRHTWRQMIAIGKASDILLGDIQLILRRIKREIGFRYLFFNGILSDEMHVCTRNSSQALVFNFAYVDLLLDFLMDVDLLPVISFSYMPAILSRDPSRRLFSHLVSEPADIREWAALIHAFTKHVLERYGRDVVEKWLFTVWHQPNSTPRLYGFRKDEDFYAFYQATRSEVKKLVPKAMFGFPPVFQNADGEGDGWFHAFLAWCRDQGCLPDFLNFTYYDTKLTREERITRETFGFVFTMVLNDKPDGLHSFISRLKQGLREEQLENLPVYLSEWNNTPSQQDLLNDTCYKSCYIVKNIIGNYDRLDSFSYWSVSDLMSEAPLPENMLFGGLGLFTANGLPKASYHALCLLSRLGDELIAAGDGWIATRAPQEIRIVACNYIHLSKMYASGERFIMTEKDRYTMFGSATARLLQITVDSKWNDSDREDAGSDIPGDSDVAAAPCIVREYLVGRRGGSLYDTYAEMGFCSLSHAEDLQLLKAHSMPVLHQYTLSPDSRGLLHLNIRLDPLDVMLVIVRNALPSR